MIFVKAKLMFKMKNFLAHQVVFHIAYVSYYTKGQTDTKTKNTNSGWTFLPAQVDNISA